MLKILSENPYFLIIGIVFLALWSMIPEDAMEICQQYQSFDTCFSTLNR